MSREDDVKGAIAPGQYADLSVLSADYLSVPEADIPRITSVLTVVDGRIVYGAEEFATLSPPLPPASPDWSPPRHDGAPVTVTTGAVRSPVVHTCRDHETTGGGRFARHSLQALWGAAGCGCWAY